MERFSILITLMSFWALAVSAQSTFLQPVQVMGTSENTLNLIATENERFLISGATGLTIEDTFKVSFFAICLDQQANLLWEYYFPPVDLNTINYTGFYNGILEVSDGYLFVGHFSDLQSTDKDLFLVKIDKETGEEIWIKEYNTLREEVARSIIQTSDGSLLVTGETRNGIDLTDFDNVDIFLMKTDAGGNIIWKQTYDSGELLQDRGFQVLDTSDGGYALACGIKPIDFGGSSEGYLIKVDGLGNKEWEFHHKPEGWSPVVRSRASLNFSLAGNLLFLSQFEISGSGSSMQLREFSLQGDTLAVNDLAGGGYWRTETMVATADGNFASYSLGNYNSFTIQDQFEEETQIDDLPLLFSKYTESGEIIWERYYHFFDADIDVKNISHVPWDNGFALTGFYAGEDATPEEPNSYILRLDENGCLDPENCGLYMWVDDGVVIDKSHLVNVGIDDFELPQLKLYPNPASDKLKVELLENAKHYLIHNIAGTQVMQSGQIKNALPELELDVSDYPPGVGVYIFKSIDQKGNLVGGTRFVKE